MNDSNGALNQGVSRDAQVTMQYDANKKSAVVAYLLWFFLGWFGAHRFYLGSTGPAVAQLVITIVSILLLIVAIGALGFLVVGIWVLVDAFLIPGLVRTYNNKLAAQLGGMPALQPVVVR